MNLLPCPFCGGDGVLEAVFTLAGGKFWTVHCRDRDCRALGPFTPASVTEAIAVELWNRRATPSADGQIVTKDGHGRALRPDENMIEAQLRGEGPFLMIPP